MVPKALTTGIARNRRWPNHPAFSPTLELCSRGQCRLCSSQPSWLFGCFDHKTFNWHGVLMVVTLIMTLFIQRSEHRDMQATLAQLDELLRAYGEARTDLKTLYEKEPEEVEAFREKEIA